jgi:Zn-dependent peptidase ImmA (M78 family)/transcriptional regulator with XRE-family HTH domain
MPDNGSVVSFSASIRRIEPRRLVPAKLRDARLAKRLNQTELAERVGVTRQAVSAYEQGEKSPDPDTLSRIASVLEQPLSYFLNGDLPTFGGESVRFFRATGPKTKRRNLACEVLGKWFVQTAKYFDGFVNFPKVDVPTFSPASEDGRYTADEIETAAEQCRSAWGLGLGPISNVIALLENKGIVVCRYKMPNETVEAFSFWNGEHPFIFLASAKESACRSRFDAAHELAHLVLHRWVGPEDLEDADSLALIEREANLFAGAFLAPQASFPTEIYTTRLDAFVALKARWKLAIKAMVVRCKQLDLFDEDQATNLYKAISARKWNTREPLDVAPAMGFDAIQFEQPKILNRAATLVLERGVKTPDDIAIDLSLNRSDVEQLCNLPTGVLASRQQPEEFRPTLKRGK